MNVHAAATPSRSRLAEAAEEIGALIERVFDSIGLVRDAFVTVLDAAERQGHQPTSADLATLGPLLTSHLDRHELIIGIGVVAAPGLLADAPHRLEWWHRDGTAGHARLEVDLDPTRGDFFDYTSAPWFDPPRRAGTRAVVGPYVDYLCTGEYGLTLSMPVAVEQRFVGISGADIPARWLEATVTPVLSRTGADTVLINESGRIMASTSAGKRTGSLLRDPSPYACHPCGELPWSLVPLAPGR